MTMRVIESAELQQVVKVEGNNQRENLRIREQIEKPEKTIDELNYEEGLNLPAKELLTVCLWELENSREDNDNNIPLVQFFRSIRLYKCDKDKCIRLDLRNECQYYNKTNR